MHCGCKLDCSQLGYKKKEKQKKTERQGRRGGEKEEVAARAVAQLMECLPRTPKAEHGVTHITLVLWRLGQEDQQFTENSRPV